MLPKEGGKIMENNNLNLDEFFNITTADVENKISTTISDEQIVKVLNGCKRLRSLLAQLSFKTCTGGMETNNEYQKSLEGSVSIELAHGASLVHDDIIDKDVVRRGKPAFHAKEGIGKALLIGHKMLANGFDIALSHGKDVAKLYVDSWNEVVNGELDEVEYNAKDMKFKDMTTKEAIFEAYNKIIDLKTAALFSSACKAGVLEADMSGDILKVFAYQLADDLVDLANGEIIESVVIPLLNKVESKTIKLGTLKKFEIKRKFARNKDKIEQFYISEIKRHIKKAEELSKEKIIPESGYKDMLVEAPAYIINKMLAEINISV